MREDWCARVRAREQSSERASGEQIEFSCVRGSVIITSIAIGGRRGVRRHFISYSMVVGDICCGRSRRGVCRSRSRRHRSSLSLCSRSSLLELEYVVHATRILALQSHAARSES